MIDNGHGIPANKHMRLTSLFSTTRRDSGETGTGLAIRAAF